MRPANDRCMRLIVLLAAFLGAATPARTLESSWVDGYKSRARLTAGVMDPGAARRVMAFVEIELPAGWKTYWRSPGDAGGLPPTFDWSKSSNLKNATVLYPAPKLMTDKSGNTIGYKDRVIFPVEIAAADAGKPIGLALALHYGICMDICVPIEAELVLDIPADAKGGAPEGAEQALASVPRTEAERRSGDPVLKAVKADLGSAKPTLVLETDFQGSGDGASVFLEAPDGLYLPVPLKTKEEGGRATFKADLSRDVDLAALRGKTITATLVGMGGASVAHFELN